MTTISVTINITIPDEEKFKKEILKIYGDTEEENIEAFIDDHLSAQNNCDGLFLVEGANGDTDGWIIQKCNLDNLMDKMRYRK